MNMIPRNDNAALAGGICQNIQSDFQPQFSSSRQASVKTPPAIRSPRELRLLQALQDGRKSRETLDRLIGASNTPDVVLRLRGKGFKIPCELVPAIDRDGRRCSYGEYELTEADRELADLVLSGIAANEGETHVKGGV